MSGDLANQSLEFTGLGTLTFTASVAGTYSCRSVSSLPTLTSGGVASGLVTTINHNGSQVNQSVAGALGCSASGIVCAVGDTITVVYTSALSTDAYPFINLIKSTVVIFVGA